MSKEFEEYRDSFNDEGSGYDFDIWFSERSIVQLAEQKALLMALMNNAGEAGGILEGILCLIDALQDQLADFHGFDKDLVFPFSNKFPDYEPEALNYRAALKGLLESIPKKELPKYININPELTKVLNQVFKGDEI